VDGWQIVSDDVVEEEFKERQNPVRLSSRRRSPHDHAVENGLGKSEVKFT
jgi:hypothetical protein